ncbi:MAG: hypothetical protein V4671_05270 [Armatimonadota bacterium]
MYLSRRKRLALILLNVPIALVLGALILDNVMPSYVRQALPASATDIQEYYSYSFNPQGDFARYLKARMPESEMPAFAVKLNLIQRYSATAHRSMSVNFGGETAYWNPSSRLDGAYVQFGPGGAAYSLAK